MPNTSDVDDGGARLLLVTCNFKARAFNVLLGAATNYTVTVGSFEGSVAVLWMALNRRPRRAALRRNVPWREECTMSA